MLFFIGFLVGTLGTMIGAGGGFLLVPILLFLFPDKSSVELSALSMCAIAFNASSGSISYYFQQKIHYKSALIFSLSSFPGAFIAIMIANDIKRPLFELIFALFLMTYSLFLILKKNKLTPENSIHAQSELDWKKYALGSFASFLVGLMASFLGIGGGVIHVPLLNQLLGFPMHLAAGTSHFILAITSWFTLIQHLSQGHINVLSVQVLGLIVGVILGAQLGAYLGKRVPGRAILKILGISLFIVGLRLLYNNVL